MDLQQNDQCHPILLGLSFFGRFNSAMDAAHQCTNGQVIFICNRRRLEAKPPYLSQGVVSSSEEGIKKYFAAFHLHDTFPVAVVIDDFGDLFEIRSRQERYGNPRGRDLAMVRTLALCHNAMIHANEIRPYKISTDHGNSGKRKSAKYSVALQNLLLEEITEASES
ncbi:hypothetical protein D8674_016676 [Pyrus ussuriensis x Pyrus communis]|uniref:Uncharacterized protein n=1 Tax=Pyrus ussuriensis x Pyrus communis TaxID=2448454 RepID=A0A5N5HAG3_9ROSA|nr:hypothetical protein D8674_016676 [Pyrus ussuriensis x Pyrus communis]